MPQAQPWGAPAAAQPQSQQPQAIPKELPAPSAPSSSTAPPANGARSWAAMVAPPQPQPAPAPQPAPVLTAPIATGPAATPMPDSPVQNSPHAAKALMQEPEPVNVEPIEPEASEPAPQSMETYGLSSDPAGYPTQQAQPSAWGVPDSQPGMPQQSPITTPGAFQQPAPTAPPQSAIYPSYAPSTVTQAPQTYPGSKDADNFPSSSAAPTSLGNGTSLNYGQSLASSGYISALSGPDTADKATADMELTFGSLRMNSPSNGAAQGSVDAVSQEPSQQMQMGVAQQSAMPMNFMPGVPGAGIAGAGMATGQYGQYQYGGAFGGAGTGNGMPQARPGMPQAGTYNGAEEMQYGGEYAAGVDMSKGGDSSTTSRNYNNRRGLRGDSKGGDNKQGGGAQAQPQQQQHPHPQQQMPQQAMQQGQHIPYAYAQQMQYQQYHPMYPQPFYGGYQQAYPQQAASYTQQPKNMRPGQHTMQAFTYPAHAQGYAQASYMQAAPATMGYGDGSYGYGAGDGSYPVQEATPATSGPASVGAADTKTQAAQAEIQQLAAAQYQPQYGGAAFPANYYQAGAYPAAQSGHMPQSGQSMQQPAYGQQQGYGGWQGAPSQGSR